MAEFRNGKGKICDANNQCIEAVRYTYIQRSRKDGSREIRGILLDFPWEKGQRLHGQVCRLYLADGIARNVNIFMPKPHAACHFTPAPDGSFWPE